MPAEVAQAAYQAFQELKLYHFLKIRREEHLRTIPYTVKQLAVYEWMACIAKGKENITTIPDLQVDYICPTVWGH